MIKYLFLVPFFFLGILNAQKKKEDDSDKKEKAEKTIADLTKSSKKISGLFTIYQDTISGGIKMVVKENQLNKDFIYFSQIADGVTEAGSFRGYYQGSSIFNIKLKLLLPTQIFILIPKTHYQNLKMPILQML